MLTDNDIDRISQRIVKRCAPLVVGTFGSYGVGSPRPGSDLDVFVISKKGGDLAARVLALKRLLFGVLHPVDVFVFTPQEFEESAYEEQSFTWVIVKQARLYHWNEEAERLIPSLLLKAAEWRLRRSIMVEPRPRKEID
jgi:predicted nucleotidyltransferase